MSPRCDFRPRRSPAPLALVLLAALAPSCAAPSESAHSAVDAEAMRAADRAYATAWLTGDPEAVMATLTEDAVLLPSGLAPLIGARAAREFWWPDGGAPTVVDEFRLVQAESGGSGSLGYVRGSFTLAFEYEGSAYRSGGAYLSLLRRTPDGWRISHRAWSDVWREP